MISAGPLMRTQYNNTRAAALDSDPMFAIETVEILITYIEDMCLVSYRSSLILAVPALNADFDARFRMTWLTSSTIRHSSIIMTSPPRRS